VRPGTLLRLHQVRSHRVALVLRQHAPFRFFVFSADGRTKKICVFACSRVKLVTGRVVSASALVALRFRPLDTDMQYFTACDVRVMCVTHAHMSKAVIKHTTSEPHYYHGIATSWLRALLQ
jgi:hypothetical protein